MTTAKPSKSLAAAVKADAALKAVVVGGDAVLKLTNITNMDRDLHSYHHIGMLLMFTPMCSTTAQANTAALAGC
jgi:hypothetical protein